MIGFELVFCIIAIFLIIANLIRISVMAPIDTSSTLQINSLRSFKDAVSQLHDLEDFSDIEIRVKGTVFKCHSLVLGAKSHKFENIFLKTDEKVEKIQLSDVSVKGFEILKRYIYTGKMNLSDEDHVLEAYHAARAYEVSGLERKCEEIIAGWDIGVDNVCDILNKVFEMEAHRQRCVFFIRFSAEAVLASDTFLQTTPTVMSIIFEAGCFKSVDPMTVIKKVLKWSTNQFTEQKVFDLIREDLMASGILGKLGFDKLNGLQLTQVITDYPNLLTAEEASHFFCHMNCPSHPLPEWCIPQ